MHSRVENINYLEKPLGASLRYHAARVTKIILFRILSLLKMSAVKLYNTVFSQPTPYFFISRACTKPVRQIVLNLFFQAEMLKESIRSFWLNSISQRHKRHKCVKDRLLHLTHDKSKCVTAASMRCIVLFLYYSCFSKRKEYSTVSNCSLVSGSHLSDMLNLQPPYDLPW